MMNLIYTLNLSNVASLWANQSSVVLEHAANKVATECRNNIWTHDKILCGLTDIPAHLRAADRGSQLGRSGFKKKKGGMEAKEQK